MNWLINKCWQLGFRVLYCLAGIYWTVVKPNIRGVFVAVWCRGKLLMIRNSYRPGLRLPGGLLKKNEEWEAAARRELAEEVGIELAPGELKFYGETPSNDRNVHDRSQIFEVELAEFPQVTVDNREVVWAEFLAPAEVLKQQSGEAVRHYLAGKPWGVE